MLSRFLPIFLVLIVAGSVHCKIHYDFPKAEFEVFYPRGFRVSIPAKQGISMFIFRGNHNAEMETNKTAQWSPYILTPTKGRFSYTNRETALRIGDIIFYKTDVLYSGVRYGEDDGKFVVTEFFNKSTNGCKRSVTLMNGVRQECADRLIFEEEFENPDLDTTKWTQQRRFGAHPDYEFVVYLVNDEVLFTRHNNLVIRPKRLTSNYGNRILRSSLNLGVGCTGDVGTNDCKREYALDILPPIITGQITTKGLFQFLYGTVKIKAKLPSIEWAFPQLFLDSTENVYGKQNLSSGQMRLAMTRGSETCDLLAGAILHSSEKFRNLKMCNKQCKNRDYSSDFHEYELKWTPDLITVSVDEELFCFVIPESGFGYLEANGERLPTADLLKAQSKMAPFDRPFHITLGLGVGGHYDFPDDTPNKPWLNKDPRAMLMFWNSVKASNYPQGEMLVDYVKVYTV